MEYTLEQIRDMIKLIPNGITINEEDLKEIYSQDELQY